MNSNKKVLYIHFEETDCPNKKGILNKLEGKYDAFNSFGYHLDIVSFKTKRILQFNSKTILKLPSRNLWFRFFIFRTILNKTIDKKYEFVYIRYFGSDAYFLWFLKKIYKRNLKIFLELPTFPYDQEKNPRNWMEKRIIALDKKYRNHLYKYIHRVITFTDDDYILKVPTLKLQNGININKYKLVQHLLNNTNSIQLIAVANLSKWHGYDRLIRGLREYYNQDSVTMKVILKIVGKGSAFKELKDLTRELDLENYISFQGIKSGEELDIEFEETDIAVGSLGMHRIGLHNGSILKLREYTARGLPSIIGYKDNAIAKDNPFVLKVEANETPIDINKLIKFYNDLKVTPEEIRAYASKYFSWEKQIDKILAKL